MSVFKDVNLSFKGKEYKIPSSNILMAIAQVEEVVSLQDLLGGKINLSKLAMAFGLALVAGGYTGDAANEVYSSFFESEAAAKNSGDATTALLLMMIPPEHLNSDFKPKKKPAKKPAKKKV
jgi:hypothetical protein